MSEGHKIYDLFLTSAGKVATVGVTNTGEVEVHYWNPSNGILVDEIVLASKVGIENIRTVFIRGEEVYAVESYGNSVKAQSYDLKTGKESQAVINGEYEGISQCSASESALVCLSTEQHAYYTQLPLQSTSKMNLLSLPIFPGTSKVEQISSVPNMDALRLQYIQESVYRTAIISFKNGEVESQER